MKRSKTREKDGGMAVLSLFDPETGEIESQKTFKIKTKLGSGWVPFYKRSLNKLLEVCPKFSILKVYLKLASKQTYQKLVVLTQSQIARELHMKPTTVSEAIKWLKDNKYLQAYSVDGVKGFLLNANVTLCGTQNLESKAELWQLGKQRDFAASSQDIEIEQKKALIASLDKLIADKILEEDPEDDTDEAFTEDVPSFDIDLLK